MRPTYLVTGGAGFIGSAFVRRLVDSGEPVLNVDAYTYAGDLRRLEEVSSNVEDVKLDLADNAFGTLLQEVAPRVVVHFAAETHVTRSETDDGVFRRTNVEGTRSVLDAAARADVALLVHLSTDEVYGPCASGSFVKRTRNPAKVGLPALMPAAKRLPTTWRWAIPIAFHSSSPGFPTASDPGSTPRKRLLAGR